jgi:hypothetical protein
VRPPRSSVLVLAAVAFVAGALAVVDRGGRRAQGTFAPASVYSETPDGLSLAYRYVGERSGGVAVLSERVRAGTLPSGGVLFRMRPLRTPFRGPAREDQDEDEEGEAGETAPSVSPPSLLTPAEEEWVRDGGRLVLGLETGYGPIVVSRMSGGGTVRKVFPLWPGVAVLHVETPRALRVEAAHTIFSRGSQAILGRIVLGDGEVLLLAVPEVLENAHLGTADHLGLLEALAGDGRPVLFDEWAHGLGQEDSVLMLMLEWGLGPALVVAALAFALFLWRGRTRLGPEEDDATDERSEAVDLVDSLAQLYDRALTRREAAALQLRGFRQAVGLRTGLQGEALDRRTRELLEEGPSLPPGDREIPASAFLQALKAVNDGYRRLEEHAHSRRRP